MKKLINEYGQHLQQARGVSESTRHQYIHYVQHFLSETFTDVFPDKLRHLQPGELIQYVIKQKEHHHEPVIGGRCLRQGQILLLLPLLKMATYMCLLKAGPR